MRSKNSHDMPLVVCALHEDSVLLILPTLGHAFQGSFIRSILKNTASLGFHVDVRLGCAWEPQTGDLKVGENKLRLSVHADLGRQSCFPTYRYHVERSDGLSGSEWTIFHPERFSIVPLFSLLWLDRCSFLFFQGYWGMARHLRIEVTLFDLTLLQTLVTARSWYPYRECFDPSIMLAFPVPRCGGGFESVTTITRLPLLI
jgi:hypothetical protein